MLHFLFLFQTIYHVKGQSSYQTNFTTQEDWMIFSNLQLLGGQQIAQCPGLYNFFGGPSNGVIFKTFFLPPHYLLNISFVIGFSSLTQLNMRLYVDDLYTDFVFGTFGDLQCNDNLIVHFNNTGSCLFSHTSRTVQIQIVLPFYNQISAQSQYFWISQFSLYTFECPYQCDSCNENAKCDKWTQISIYFWEQNILQIEGWIKNNQPFGGIASCGNFQFYGPFSDQDVIKLNSIISFDHSEIRIRLKIINIFEIGSVGSLKIQVNNEEPTHFPNYALNNLNLTCGNSQTIIAIDNQFPHNVPNLLISITILFEDGTSYLGIRDFEIFTYEQKIEESELCNFQNIYAYDGCFNFQYDCIEGCSSCVKGQCFECHSNWQYDLLNNYCIPFCGDSIIVGFEECDDSNQIPYDGCHQCQFSCPLNCLQCKFGKCLICNFSFQLVNNICIPYCIGLLNNENQQQIIECLNTNHNCQSECLECQYTLYMKCLPGWKLFNFECVPQLFDVGVCQFQSVPESSLSQKNCGDGIIQDLEECDDANTIPFDGCFECQLQCEENCIYCIDGVCLLSKSEELLILDCDYGFYLIDQKCLSICGDSIVALDEKCDDDNNEPFDGCFKCQYSCSPYCQNCIEGQCMTCDIGYQLKNNRCYEQCGNGIKSFNEECDDGNIFPLDGCSEECQIENLWKCNTDGQERSLCFQFDNPIIQLQYLNVTFNKQFILMTSSQNVKLKESFDNLTQNLKTQIINVNNLDYIITIDFEDEPTFEEFHDIKYLFTIELLNQLEVDLLFQVSFNISLINNYDLEILNKELTLKLKNPIILNQQQKEISQKASQFNLMMLIILGASSIIILLSGNPSDCFEALDALQYQSYLRFLNVVFPENVFIYFESSELLSIQPVLIQFNLVDIFSLIFGQELLESFGKFYFYSINADLLINFQSQICQIMLLLLFAIVYCTYVRIQYKNCFTLSQIIHIRLKNYMILEKIVIILYQINQFIHSLGKMFALNGLIIWFLANSWDIIFKIILYLYSKPQNSFRTQLSITLCIGIMLVLFAISISYTINTAQNQKHWNLKLFRHQGLLVIKKCLFLFFLIKAQDSSIIQCILIALINTLYLGIIIMGKLLKDTIDIIVIFWFEIPIIIFTLLSLTYHPDFVKHITNNQQILIGFSQIAMLCFGLLSPLIKYGYILINKVKYYIINNYKNRLAQNQKKNGLEQMFL